jgi:hypothetical protein
MSLYDNLDPDAAKQAKELALPPAEAFLLSAAVSQRKQAESLEALVHEMQAQTNYQREQLQRGRVY